MTDRLVLDYGNMFADRLGGRGLAPGRLGEMADRFAAAHAAAERRHIAGELGFLDLPHETELVGQIRTFADGVGQAFDTVVVLGIGGSALGARALLQALRPPFWNELTDEQREYYPRLYIVDNIDPTTVGPLLDRLDLRRTLVNVVSKSGGTAETAAQFLILRDRLIAALGDEAWRRHLIFTTDPESGALRKLASDDSIPALPIPRNVGGRFSVLSAAGLLPAALAGIDIDGLLRGAAAMADRCRTPELTANPAGLFATLQYLAHTDAGAPIHVMMPYSDRLLGVADWFRQLWAESLGKRRDRAGEDVFRGPTPVTALGATDQHSQIQLFMEGPFDKTVTFLTVAGRPVDLPIPAAYPEIPELAYLGGHTLGALFDAERAGTTHALTQAGRMNLTIELPAADAPSLGQLLMLLELATVYAGELYDVEALDQPGVELGKRLAFALLGRPGFPAPDLPAPDPARICR